MRLLRVLAAATTFAALITQPSAAQDGRQFKDAWFWGVKGGSLLYSSAIADSKSAPLIGGEWLIARTYGGLYVAYDQVFMQTQGQFVDRDVNNQDYFHPVALSNMRRVSIAGMVFPMQSTYVHPYGGIGFSFNQVNNADLIGNSINAGRQALALDSIQNKRTSFSPIFLAGVQYKLRPASVFVQTTFSPIQQNFFLSNNVNGRAFALSLEAGIRYNVGSSIDKVR
jgi:hypothetical protein